MSRGCEMSQGNVSSLSGPVVRKRCFMSSSRSKSNSCSSSSK